MLTGSLMKEEKKGVRERGEEEEEKEKTLIGKIC